MKRQLNFWSNKIGSSEEELINISLSIDSTQFTAVFQRPGSSKPITQIAIDVDSEKSFDLKYAFELCGANIFQDEMDERIYFSNIARQRDSARHAENLGVTTGGSILFYIACMIISVVFLNIPIHFALCLNLFISILFAYFLCKKVVRDNEMKPTKDLVLFLEKRFKAKQKINNEIKDSEQ